MSVYLNVWKNFWKNFLNYCQIVWRKTCQNLKEQITKVSVLVLDEIFAWDKSEKNEFLLSLNIIWGFCLRSFLPKLLLLLLFASLAHLKSGSKKYKQGSTPQVEQGAVGLLLGEGEAHVIYTILFMTVTQQALWLANRGVLQPFRSKLVFIASLVRNWSPLGFTAAVLILLLWSIAQKRVSYTCFNFTLIWSHSTTGAVDHAEATAETIKKP